MPSQQEQQTQQHQHVTNTPGESPAGRLSRWFSIRRGSAHQYDVGGREGGGGGGGGGNRNSLENNDEQLQQQIQQQQQQQQQQSQRVPTGSKMPQLPETEEDQHNTFGHGLIGTQNNTTTTTTNNTTTSLLNNSRNGGRHHHQITPTLPPAPAGLSQQQLKRRHIVAAIVHSENSYVATLQRLVNDYKRPLEDSQPPILSSTKILTLFHRLPEILQCHTVFRLELADCVRNWDRDEKIGDVFIGSFSKPILLDIYSGFINNFSLAMELAKMEAKRKSALSDFFKVKQISAHDRLSFFGLMVKPVQRFPQFILFLQDLLKYTPQGHHDRMSLQLALTQLESLAEMLNERKREAEQYQAFKEMLGHISGTFNTRSLSSTTSDGSRHRYLLREDNVTQMEFNQSGLIVKSKQRRLLLLNDKVICVSVAPKQSHDFGATEKLSFKWMYPVTDVEIVDNSTSATLSRILTAGLNRGGSLKSNSSGGGRDVISSSGGGGSSGANDSATQLTNGADNLCSEMSNLMHDYEVMSRINDLVGTLKGYYKEMNVDVTKRLLTTIQSSIQKKDEEMAWVDSCCLQLITKNKSGKEETYTFQTENPNVKKEWITELRLAQLALDTNNSPAWEFPEHEQRRPLTKMPLFVKAQSVYKSQHQTEVRCGCYYGVSNTRASQRRYKNQNYVWICTSDGLSSHIAILSQHHQQAGVLKDVGSFDLVETQVTAMEFVKSPPGVRDPDSVWMCTDSRKIIFYDARNPGNDEQLGFCNIPGVATQILSHMEGVFVALSNGNVIIYRRSIDGGNWILKDPLVVQLSTAGESVTSILPINANVYAACGKKVWVLNCFTGEIIKSFDIKHRQQQQQSQSQSPQQHMMNGGSGVGSGGNNNVNLMAHSGIGLWISLKNSSIICLYHTETFKHLQDINIATNVLRVTSSSQKESLLCNNNNSSVFVTALMACKGLLWVGTNVGISLTIPLPRLEGVPIISGGVNISYHAHFGPITFMLPLIPKAHYSQQQMQQLAQQSPARIILPQTTITTKEKDNKDISDVSVGGSGNRMVLTDSNPETPKKKLEKQSSMDYPLFNISAKLRAQLANSPVMLRKKSPNPKEMNADSSRISKTLPRGGGLGQHGGFFSTSMNSNSSSQGSEPGYCDVYGLYGDLIFVKEDFDPEVGQLNLMDQSYECLRRSDPELACENYIAKVSTLDRRLRLKVGRPRSLDLSNWSVESRSSSLYTSSGSEESMAIRHNSMFGRSVSRNSSSASHKTQTNPSELNNITENCTVPPPSSVTDVQQQQPQPIIDETTTTTATTMSNNIIQQPDITTTSTILPPPTSTMMKKKKNNNNKNAQPIEIGGRRTVISLMGGRGYINWRHVWYNNNSTSGGDKNKSNSSSGLSNSSNSRVPNSNDAHIVIWEKKL